MAWLRASSRSDAPRRICASTDRYWNISILLRPIAASVRACCGTHFSIGVAGLRSRSPSALGGSYMPKTKWLHDAENAVAPIRRKVTLALLLQRHADTGIGLHTAHWLAQAARPRRTCCASTLCRRRTSLFGRWRRQS
jgi:hypothetical protein